VATEYIYGKQTSSVGYYYTYLSSNLVPTGTHLARTELEVDLNMQSPTYYYRILNIQQTSALDSIVNIVALVGAVITVGTMLGNALSVLHKKWKDSRPQDQLQDPFLKTQTSLDLKD